jgi:hypothetical protein
MMVNSSQSSSLLSSFHAITARCDFLASRSLSSSQSAFPLSSFVFEGPHGGGDPIPLGFFGGIHGDEPAGSAALLRFTEILAEDPELAKGYELHLYPICNPSGFDAGSRQSAAGKDLNREFWNGSGEPEVQILESEILRHSFRGLVSLHSDDTSAGLYGFVRGAVLARSLLEPALAAGEKFLPRNTSAVIDGFPAENGIIAQCYDGILTSPPKLAFTPFEVIFETPQAAPFKKQVDASVAALLSILTEYREFIAFAADL